MESGLLGFPRSLLVKRTDQVFFTRTALATTFSGTVNIGDGAFDGISSGTFVGSSSSGTLLAVNSTSAFGGALFTVQQGGANRLSISNSGIIRIPNQVTGAQNAILSLGSASFSASALGGFAGNSNGNIIACDVTAAFTGDLVNLQLASSSNTPNAAADVRLKLDYQGQMTLAQPPQGVATTALVMLGSGGFAGGGAPAFNGSISGTVIGINTATGYGGNLEHFQVAGVDKWKLTGAGNATAAGTLVGTNLPAVAAKGDLIVGTSANNASVLTVGSNGKMAIADSTAATGISYVLPWIQKFLTTCWYSSCSGSNTSATLGDQNLRVTPLFVPNQVTLVAIAAEVTVVGTTGSVIRLGIYNDDGTGFPGTLLLDAGTISGLSATVQSITISQVVGPGLYWLAAVTQGAPATQPTMRTIGGSSNTWGQLGNSSTTAPTSVVNLGYLQGSVAGALGNWTGANNNVSGQAVRVMVKVQ